MLFYVQDERYVMVPRMAKNDVQDERYAMVPWMAKNDVQDERYVMVRGWQVMTIFCSTSGFAPQPI